MNSQDIDGIPERDPADLESIEALIERHRDRVDAARVREWTDWPFLVRCVDRPEWGAVTCEWAAGQIGVGAGRVAEHANAGRKRLRGMRLHRDGYPFKARTPRTHKPVVCLENGREFPTIKAAAAWVGAKSSATVAQAVADGNTAKGFHFYRKGEQPPERTKGVKGGKVVVCVETGKRYGSMSEAASAFGCWCGTIAYAVRHGSAVGGKHFRFAGRPAVPPRPPKGEAVRSECGRRFGTKTEAMRWAVSRAGLPVPSYGTAGWSKSWMAFSRAMAAGAPFMGVEFSPAVSCGVQAVA
jgi:hypothetical protein